MGTHLSAHQRQEICRLHQNGIRPQDIAKMAGITLSAVRHVLSPQDEEERRGRKYNVNPFRRVVAIKGENSADASAERLLKQVPADTRGLTARLMGDPLPGRSANDKRPTTA